MKSFKFFLASLLLSSFIANAQISSIQLLSGLEKGTYNELSNNIKNITTVPMKVLTSGGAAENFQKITQDPTITLTFMQYDVLMNEAQKDQNLRKSLMIFLPLFLDEEIHLITKKDLKYKGLKSLTGKKVAIGTKEQGTNATARIIKEKLGITWTDVEISSNDAVNELIKGNIDAFFYVGGAPINMLQTLPEETKKQLRLQSIQDEALNSIYTAKTIPAGTYDWQSGEVKTYAVTLLLIMNTNISKETVAFLAQIRKDIMKNVSTLQSQGHAKWKAVYYQNAEIKWPYYYFPDDKD